MYGVTADLGFAHTPRMAIKVAHYLTPSRMTAGSRCSCRAATSSHKNPPSPTARSIPPAPSPPDLTQGDGVLFENRTWHAGGINLSGHPRIAVMLQYGYGWLHAVDDSATDLMTDPTLSLIEQQLLGMPDRNEDGSLAEDVGAAPLKNWWSSRRPTPPRRSINHHQGDPAPR
jgi:hypothetical protein